MILKKSFILIIILILFNATFIDSFAGIRKTEATYKINTLSVLKDELNLHNGNVYSDITKDKIIKETDPAVLKEYADEKIKQAIFVLNSINLDDILEEESEGTYIGKKTIDLGEGSKLIIELEDKEDRTLFSNIKDFFIPTAYAASNGETLWKSYGNRYFTAKTTILSGIGGCLCSLENHYTLSKNGIDIRYGDAYENYGFNVGVTGTVTHNDPIITDASARTPGKSDVNMYVRFNWNYGVPGMSQQGNTKLSTTVGYVDIDPANKQIKVKHSWTVS